MGVFSILLLDEVMKLEVFRQSSDGLPRHLRSTQQPNHVLGSAEQTIPFGPKKNHVIQGVTASHTSTAA